MTIDSNYVNVIMALVLLAIACIGTCFWLSPMGLRNVANYCEARAAGLDVYRAKKAEADRAFRETYRANRTPRRPRTVPMESEA